MILMKCRKVQENLVDLLLGILPKETEREIRAHIDTCRRCREEYGSFAKVQKAVDAVPEITPSEYLEDRILHRYWEAQRKSYSHRLRIIAAHHSFARYFSGWLFLQIRRPAVAAVLTALIAAFIYYAAWEKPAKYTVDISDAEKLPMDSDVLDFIRERNPVPRRHSRYNLERILEEMADVEMTDVPEQPWRKWEMIEEIGDIREISLLNEEGELVQIPFSHSGGAMEKTARPRRYTRTKKRDPYMSEGIFSPGEVYASYEGVNAKDVIQDGLQWLNYTQHSDGSWGMQDYRIFTTSLAGMCFLADADMMETFGYRERIERACSYILGRATGLGYLGGGDKYSARSHITALNFLVEYARYTGRNDLKDEIVRGFNYTYSMGNLKGWETDDSYSSDSSVVGWYMTLLISARKAGYTLPRKFYDRARSWMIQAAYGGSQLYCAEGPYFEEDMGKTAIMFAGRQFFNVKLYKKDISRIAERLVSYVGRKIDQGTREIDPYFLYFASAGLFEGRGKEWYVFNLGIKNYLSDTAEHITFPNRDKGIYWPSAYKRYSRYGDIFYTAMHILTLQTHYRFVEFAK